MRIRDTKGNTIYIYKDESTTIKECVENAVKRNISLSEANLSKADLSEADLSEADLSGADLSEAKLFRADLFRADLFRADLSGADLSEANLRGADLSRANLRGADLSRADFSGANLNSTTLYGATIPDGITLSLIPIQVSTGVYYITIFDSHMQIGCEFHSLKEWWKFNNEQIIEMDGKKALTFWKAWKKPLQLICKNNNRK